MPIVCFLFFLEVGWGEGDVKLCFLFSCLLCLICQGSGFDFAFIYICSSSVEANSKQSRSDNGYR